MNTAAKLEQFGYSQLPPGIEKLMGDYEKLIKKQEADIRKLIAVVRMFVTERLPHHVETCACDWCTAVELVEWLELAQ